MSKLVPKFVSPDLLENQRTDDQFKGAKFKSGTVVRGLSKLLSKLFLLTLCDEFVNLA